MSLTISEDLYPDAIVLRLIGRLDAVTAKTLDDYITGEIGRGRGNLVVHMAGVDYVSSYGLRVLLLNAKKLRGPGESFTLCDLVPSVSKVVEMCGFDRIIFIYPTLEDALAAAR